MFSLSSSWFPKGDEKEGDKTSNSRQHWGLSSQLSLPGGDTDSGDGHLQIAGALVSCPCTPLFFPEKAWFLCRVCGLCDHLAVRPLLMLPVGSRNWPGCGRGLPSTPLPWQGSGTLAPQCLELSLSNSCLIYWFRYYFFNM